VAYHKHLLPEAVHLSRKIRDQGGRPFGAVQKPTQNLLLVFPVAAAVRS
jgi:hypothetical protein